MKAVKSIPFWSLDGLAVRQYSAVQHILRAIHLAATRSQDGQVADPPSTSWRHVHLINGARGAGKTHTLTVLRNLAHLLNAGDRPSPQGGQATRWDSKVAHGRDALEQLDAAYLRAIPGQRAAALVLPTLYPGDFAAAEDPVEAIMAHIAAAIVKDKEKAEREADKRELQKLYEQCIAISRGWMFSRNVGADALIYNSASFEQFSRERAQQTIAAVGRLHDWQDFVSRYLDKKGCGCMVVTFDDTDSQETARLDLVHMIRSYFEHPRIVVVMAANLRSMRQAMVQHRMGELSPAFSSFDLGRQTPEGWRQSIRREVAEVIDKTFPPAKRYWLARQPSPYRPTTQRQNGESGGRVQVSKQTLPLYTVSNATPEAMDLLCLANLRQWRASFIKAKKTAYDNFNSSLSEGLIDTEQRAMENFIAWWLFRLWYRKDLEPQSARQIQQFLQFFGVDTVEENGTLWERLPTKKRLSVALFEQSQNFDLFQRFSDQDEDIVEWLRRQSLGSTWTGRRKLIINERDYFEDTYSHSYLLFRLDIGIAQPLRLNGQERIPSELLPRFVGCPDWPAFLSPAPYEQQLFGLAKSLRHPAVPANLIHFHDLRLIPDSAFEACPAPRGEPIWEADLASHWRESFEDQPSAEMALLRKRVFPALARFYGKGSRHSPIQDLDSAETVDPAELLLTAIMALRAPSTAWGGVKSAGHLHLGALLNDLRRGWLAIRIFAGSIPEAETPLERAAESGDGFAINSTKDLVSRADRIMVPTFQQVASAIALSEALRKMIYPRLYPERGPKVNNPTPGALSDQENELVKSFIKGIGVVGGDPIRARLARQLLLFLYAFLPSLKAVATLNLLTVEGGDERKQALLAWRDFLTCSAAFHRKMHAALRLARLRMRISARGNERGSYIDRLLIPDFSWSSLFGDPKSPDSGPPNLYGLRQQAGLLKGVKAALAEAARDLDAIERAFDLNGGAPP